MKKQCCALFLFVILLPLAACGFHPLYGTSKLTGTGPQEAFQSIYVDNIPDRPGQELRNDLIDRLYTHGSPVNPRYILQIKPLEQHVTDLDINITSDATRAELRIVSGMTLKDVKTGETLLYRDLLTVNDYNILSSQFTTLESRAKIQEDELNDLARQIETQLALYFARQAK